MDRVYSDCRRSCTVEWKNVELLAGGFDFRVQMLIGAARGPRFWCCSTISLAHSYLVKQLGRGESCSWQHLSVSLSLYTVQGAQGKGHINVRLPDDVHGLRESLWKRPLCLNKPVHAAEGVNKAGPPSLHCPACQPGDSLAWVGVTVSLPGSGHSTTASTWKSHLLLGLHAHALEGKVLPPVNASDLAGAVQSLKCNNSC